MLYHLEVMTFLLVQMSNHLPTTHYSKQYDPMGKKIK